MGTVLHRYQQRGRVFVGVRVSDKARRDSDKAMASIRETRTHRNQPVRPSHRNRRELSYGWRSHFAALGLIAILCCTAFSSPAKAQLPRPESSKPLDVQQRRVLEGLQRLPQPISMERLESALIEAALANHIEVAAWLLERGADVNAMDPLTGDSVLHLAVEHQDRSWLELLSRYRPDYLARNSAGQSAREAASDSAMKEWLRQLEANPDAFSSSPGLTRPAQNPSDGMKDVTTTQNPPPIQSATPSSPNADPAPTPRDATERPPRSRFLPDELHRMRQAVALVGHPEVGWHSGFVISIEHRLLVTTAMAAQTYHEFGTTQAYLHGRSEPVRVVNTWFHPSTIRLFFGGRDLRLRASDARVGWPAHLGPQLALVQLEPGVKLPFTLELATNETPQSLDNSSLSTIGYSGKPTPLVNGSPANAELGTTKVDGFQELNLVTADESISISTFRINSPLDKSSAGAPVIDQNAKVLGVVSPMKLGAGDTQKPLAVCLPSRTVWEIINSHQLSDQLPRWVDRPSDSYRLPLSAEPAALSVLQAEPLVEAARDRVSKGNYQDAIESLRQASLVEPRHPGIYLTRSHLHVDYAIRYRSKISEQQYLKQYEYALKAVDEFLELYPDSMRGTLIRWTIHNNLPGRLPGPNQGDPLATHHQVLKVCDELENREELSFSDRAEIHNLRAGGFIGLRRFQDAHREFERAIELDPEASVYFENRAQLWQMTGETENARRDRKTARALRKGDADDR